jgi:hypothetical protein
MDSEQPVNVAVGSGRLVRRSKRSKGCRYGKNGFFGICTCDACKQIKVITDTERLDWLQAQEVKRALETETHGKEFDHLVLAEDGTTCWGKTYRDAIDAAMTHSLSNISR